MPFPNEPTTKALWQLVNVAASVVIICFLPAINRFFTAHPGALFVAVGAMLVLMFAVQVKRLSREKAAQTEEDRP